MQGNIALLAAEEHLVVLLALVEHWGTVLFLLLGAPLLSSSVDTIQCLKRLYLASSVGLQLTLFLMGSTPYLANSPRTSSCRKSSLLPVIYRIKDMIQHFQKNKSNYFFVLMVFCTCILSLQALTALTLSLQEYMASHYFLIQ